MIKFKVFIDNDNLFGDSVYVNITLPSVPREGQSISLGEEIKNELEDKAKRKISVAKNYAGKWFYGISRNLASNEITEKNLTDLSFVDANYIKNVIYTANSEVVIIVLNDSAI